MIKLDTNHLVSPNEITDSGKDHQYMKPSDKKMKESSTTVVKAGRIRLSPPEPTSSHR
jgi:hypothetical protein